MCLLVVCVYPNVVNNVTNQCVNVLIDSNNCGGLAVRCPVNSSCSAGVCSDAPGIQLNNSVTIFSSSTNGEADDQMFNAILPWNITLYNTTTSRLTATTDGVSQLRRRACECFRRFFVSMFVRQSTPKQVYRRVRSRVWFCFHSGMISSSMRIPLKVSIINRMAMLPIEFFTWNII